MDAQDNDDADTEQPTDETLKTEHEVMDVQQVDAAQGVAGTSEEHNGQEVCVCVDYLFILYDYLDILPFCDSICWVMGRTFCLQKGENLLLEDPA